MTLHEAIEWILNENPEGLSITQITEMINQRGLYQRKDRLPVENTQVSARVNNYSHLFYVESGRLFSYKKFKEKQTLFDFIIQDVISSTTEFDISVKTTTFPFLIFLKRIMEAESNAYGLNISADFRDFFDNMQNDLSKIDLAEYKKELLICVQELTDNNYQLGPARQVLNDIIKNYGAGLFLHIHQILDRYDFDSKQFSNKEFGFFFTLLLERLDKSISHLSRSSTPDDINKLLSSLYQEKFQIIMDPFAGTGNTLVKRQGWNSSAIIIGYETSKEIWLNGLLNLILNGIDPLFFYNSNALKIDGIFKKKADLIITDIPLGGVLKKESFDFLNWSDTSDSTSIYIQYILDSLNKDGKAVVVIPPNFLFTSNSKVRKLREVLVENNWLDAVITLPAGIFLPYAGIASAILCINLEKKTDKDFLFIDASEIKLIKRTPKEYSVDDDDIETILQTFFARASKFENQRQIFSGTVSEDEISDSNYDLSPKRYISSGTSNSQMGLFREEQTELGSLLTLISDKAEFSSEITLRQISIKELKPSLTNFVLRTSEIPIKEIQEGKTLGHLEKNALLLTTHFSNLKPTYFEYEDQPVLIPRAIKAFSVDQGKVDIGFLISQFYESYFIQQLDAIRKGSSQQFFSIKDFLKLKIWLPSIKEQKLAFDKALQVTISKKANEAELLTKELQKHKATAVADQIAIISSIQHELGNKLPALKNTIDDLKAFAIQAEKNAAVFSIDAKIRPVLPGEDEKEVDSIKNIFDRIDSILNYTISMVDDAGGIITSDPSKFKPQKARLFEYLKSEIDNFMQVHGQKENIHFELPVEEGPIMNIDKKQFSKALNNLVLNAIRHGFTDSRKQYHMVFQLVPDDKYDILIIKNDGNAFPDDFTIEKYKQPYQYAGKNGHSGLGGYIINQVIENHGGVMDLIKDIDPADSFKVQFEFKFPKAYFL